MIENTSSVKHLSRRSLLAMATASLVSARAFAQEGIHDRRACLSASIVGRVQKKPLISLPIPTLVESSFIQIRELFGIDNDVTISMPDDTALARQLGSPSTQFLCGQANDVTVLIPAKYYAEKINGDYEKLIFILGHELSHVAQLKTQFKNNFCEKRIISLKKYELLCDLGAGFAHYKLEKKSTKPPIQLISSVADYQFAKIGHHGTVTERTSAFNLGRTLAARNKTYSMESWIRNIAAIERGLFPTGYTSESEDITESTLERLYQ